MYSIGASEQYCSIYKIVGKGFLYYFVLYDLNDNLIAYFDTLIEFKSQFHYEIKELNRKFKNSRSNFILFNIENKKYKLYKFS